MKIIVLGIVLYIFYKALVDIFIELFFWKDKK